jgi:3,4-dihydroxy 2-butanone 4-phosphate synthase / GTP cyclohydrolase II
MISTLDCSLTERLDALRRGGIAALVSDDPSDCGLVAVAERIEPLTVAFLVRYGTGYLRVAILNADADRLNLPLMRGIDRTTHTQRYTVSVDAAEGITTGISAADRAHTIRLLADPDARDSDFCRPGHVVPIRVNAGATIAYEYPEAAVDLARLAGLRPAAVFTEVTDPVDIRLLDRSSLERFGREHQLPLLDIEELREAASAFGIRPPTLPAHR